MKLKLIDYKTAKLAKKVGFDVFCATFFDRFGDLKKSELAGEDYTAHEDNILAPAQALLQKWLREVKNISVEVDATKEGWDADLYYVDGKTIMEGLIMNKKSYEEALEKGLWYALEILEDG